MRNFAFAVYGYHKGIDADGNDDLTAYHRLMVADGPKAGRLIKALQLMQDWGMPNAPLVVFHAQMEDNLQEPEAIAILRRMATDPTQPLAEFGLTDMAWVFSVLVRAKKPVVLDTRAEAVGIWQYFLGQQVVCISSDYHMPRVFKEVELARQLAGAGGLTIPIAADSTLYPGMLPEVAIAEPIQQKATDVQYQYPKHLRPHMLLPKMFPVLKKPDGQARLQQVHDVLTKA